MMGFKTVGFSITSLCALLSCCTLGTCISPLLLILMDDFGQGSMVGVLWILYACAKTIFSQARHWWHMVLGYIFVICEWFFIVPIGICVLIIEAMHLHTRDVDNVTPPLGVPECFQVYVASHIDSKL